MAHWQAEAVLASGATFIFGIKAKDLPRALRKAFEMTAECPGIARQLTVTRMAPPRARARPR